MEDEKIVALEGEVTNEKEGFNLGEDEVVRVPRRQSDFRGDNLCAKKREFEDLRLDTTKDDRYDNAIAVKTAMHRLLHGEMEKSEIADLTDQIIEGDYETERTGELRKDELVANIQRAVNGERRKPLEGIEKKIISIGDYDVSVKPDEAFDNGKEIEVVMYRAGRPNVTQNGSKRDHSVESCTELYLLLQYAKTLVPLGESRKIKASYYFLKKSTDSGQRDNDFFSGKGGNVVTLEDAYTNDGTEAKTDCDRKLDDMIEEYAVGRECSGDDCEHCILNSACNYVKEPELLEKKEIRKKGPIVLSEAQTVVTNFTKGICRVIAGAGAGKTECVATRFANLIEMMVKAGMDANAAAKSILMITFTDAGCNEMRARVMGKLEAKGIIVDADSIIARTFNAFAFKDVLCNMYEEVGFTAMPRVIDKIRNRRIITELLETTTVTGLNYLHFSTSTGNLRGALACAEKTFDIIKSQNIDLEDEGVTDTLRAALQEAGYYSFMCDQSIDELCDLYVDYAKRLISENLVTFGDQEPMMFKILQKHPGYLDQFGFKHIIVDEFQDSNDVQMRTIKMFTDTSCFESLMVVGDDSQSIFGFRNTTPENILHFFEKIGKEGIDYYLVDNHRSTPEILELANGINALNVNRMDKDLVATRESSIKPIIHGFRTADEEYKYIAEKMKELIEVKGYKPDEIAFIAGTNDELHKMSGYLSEAGLPWVLMNPMILAKNSKVMAAMALADAMYQPETTANYFTYLAAVHDGEILNLPHEQIQEEISNLKSKFLNMDLMTIPEQRVLFHKYLDAIKGNDEIYAYFLELLYANEDFQSELEYTRDFKKFGEDEAKRMAQQYVGIVLTTAHSSKGLEWRVVFNSISKYDSKSLHSKRTGTDEKVEEKRRLLFVSMTRARDILFVTGQYVAYGTKDDETYNQFLREVYQVAGKQKEYEAELMAMKIAQAQKEREMKERRNARQRERYAAKKAQGGFANYSKNLPGQISFS